MRLDPVREAGAGWLGRRWVGCRNTRRGYCCRVTKGSRAWRRLEQWRYWCGSARSDAQVSLIGWTCNALVIEPDTPKFRCSRGRADPRRSPATMNAAGQGLVGAICRCVRWPASNPEPVPFNDEHCDSRADASPLPWGTGGDSGKIVVQPGRSVSTVRRQASPPAESAHGFVTRRIRRAAPALYGRDRLRTIVHSLVHRGWKAPRGAFRAFSCPAWRVAPGGEYAQFYPGRHRPARSVRAAAASALRPAAGRLSGREGRE